MTSKQFHTFSLITLIANDFTCTVFSLHQENCALVTVWYNTSCRWSRNQLHLPGGYYYTISGDVWADRIRPQSYLSLLLILTREALPLTRAFRVFPREKTGDQSGAEHNFQDKETSTKELSCTLYRIRHYSAVYSVPGQSSKLHSCRSSLEPLHCIWERHVLFLNCWPWLHVLLQILHSVHWLHWLPISLVPAPASKYKFSFLVLYVSFRSSDRKLLKHLENSSWVIIIIIMIMTSLMD